MENSSQEIAQIKAIIRTIGTPFDKPQLGQLDSFDLHDLYHLAKKNKIGLFFLESLPDKLVVDKTQNELEAQRLYQNNLKQTAVKVASILNKINCKYAIIKSNFPFPAVPNDVDILILGNKSDHRNAILAILNGSFEKLGEAPLESCFHDQSRGQHKDPMTKDSFDVDVYKEVGAGHIIYMDKKKLLAQLDQTSIDGHLVSTLNPMEEMALSMFHSIFPERMFTLLLHYYILYSILNMSETQMVEFSHTCSEHRLRTAALITLSLSETIQEICFGETPQKLIKLREKLGKKIPVNITTLPYHYPTIMILNSFWNKKNDPVFTYSLLRQVLSMLDPKYARYVFSVNRDRKNRDTY